jgi:hypothetical protein
MLDEERLEALRSWGERLRQSGGEESVAIGRAILMLVEEIDRLHVELWHARLPPSEPTEVERSTGEDERKSIPSALHTRLAGVLRRRSQATADAGAEPPEASTTAEETSSAQAWIDALRRSE